MVQRPPAGTIPDAPGSYQFKDAHGRVIYVGKAKSLRSRLSNYFQKNLPIRTAQMVATAETVEWMQVNNDVEALLLENTLIKQHKPVIFYWWTPQYLNASLNLTEVKLPARFKGCQDDASNGGNPAAYRCAYDAYPLEKLFSKKFAQSGSPAVKVLRKFQWSNEDQNLVAKWIAGDKMSPEDAAARWVKANPAKVKAWLR